MSDLIWQDWCNANKLLGELIENVGPVLQFGKVITILKDVFVHQGQRSFGVC